MWQEKDIDSEQLDTPELTVQHILFIIKKKWKKETFNGHQYLSEQQQIYLSNNKFISIMKNLKQKTVI